MIQELQKLPYHKIKQLLLNKEISTTELVRAYIDICELKNKKSNAYREITSKYALKQAIASQERINRGEHLKIESMLIGIKDNFCTKGVLTTACSKMLENFIPPYESTVTNKLFSKGAIMLGKTNMDEFGMGSSNTNSYFGNVINPYKASNVNKDLVAGGSSGGSAAAVAAGMCMGALGTDTGGSVRLPAAFTGTIGVKPTYGRCSRYGIIAFASSLDQAGIFANNITDAALILESIIGFDENDSTSVNLSLPNLLSNIGRSIKGIKVGIPKEYQKYKVNNEITSHLKKVEKYFLDANAEIIDITLPHTDYALAAYYIIASAEASSNLARYDGVRYGNRIINSKDNFQDMIMRTRNECFGAEVKQRIVSGTYVLSANHFGDYYEKAQKIRRLITKDFTRAFDQVDIILSATSAKHPFPIEDKLTSIDMYNNDLFTVPPSLAGLPCISIPVGLSKNKLPIAIQLIANSYDEETLFKCASVIEKQANFSPLAY